MNPEEQGRIEGILQYERDKWRRGLRHVAGLDEAGRGPLAGPVVAAAVIFDEDPYIPLVDDSKKLSSEVREFLYREIVTGAVAYGIGVGRVEEIDRINILQATYLAMRRAISHLQVPPDFLLVDGRACPSDAIPHELIIKGDSLSFSIAAASILAKVTRDRIMSDYDQQFPGYGFAQHKGYATRAHLDAIEEFGFCEIHRRSFHPKRFSNQLDLFEYGEKAN